MRRKLYANAVRAEGPHGFPSKALHGARLRRPQPTMWVRVFRCARTRDRPYEQIGCCPEFISPSDYFGAHRRARIESRWTTGLHHSDDTAI